MLKKSKLVEKLPSNLWPSLNPSCTLFAPQNFAQALFSKSIGTAVIPRRNGKQSYANFWGANEVHYRRCASGKQAIPMKKKTVRLISLT